MHSNILPYLVNQGVMTDIMISNGILNSKDYLNVEIYNSENFRNIMASSTLMTSALLKGAIEVMDNYNELLLIINQKIE